MIDCRLWGKSQGLTDAYPLIGHLLDTGVVAGALWDGFLAASQQRAVIDALQASADDARSLVVFWAALHDVGKIHPRFQAHASDRPLCAALLAEDRYAHRRHRDSRAKPVGHQVVTARVLPELLVESGYGGDDGRRPAELVVAQVAQLLGGHHGRYPEHPSGDPFRPVRDLPEIGVGGWHDQRRAHVSALREVLGHPAAAPCGDRLPTEVAVVVSGLVVVADWLASQDDFVGRQQRHDADAGGLGTVDSLRSHAARSAAEAPGLLSGAGLGRAQFAARDFRGYFPTITTPHPLQTSVDSELAASGTFDGGPGILLVTAPPGEGKTEVALSAAAAMGRASGCPGVAFLLPTRATADQLYGRVVAFGRENLLGEAQLTLLHGAADLNEQYVPEPRTLITDPAPARCGASVSAGRWLRTRGRGLLAPLSVGTIDQALMAVLPLRHNALRQLGLSGKTVIIDEAHAYDAFTHALLLRLLVWLGALRTPVILLSATLTGRTATGMVEAYLTGTGRRPGSYELPSPSYPGWLYADAATGAVTVPREPIDTNRPTTLDIDLRPVTHTYDPAAEDGRVATLIAELAPVAASGGCAAVICTTVGEAQQTYAALREHFREPHGPAAGPRLRLLHARFPGWRRGAITAEAESWFGRVGKEGVRRPTPPQGTILVSTQVIEQSLDMDFDLMVTDLAPMALLLQRAGRVWRHAATAPYRPQWCHGPRLVVLAPVVDNEFRTPRTWGDVYAPSLLRRTQELLERRRGQPVRVPGDVQELVDGVYDEEFASKDPDKLLAEDIDRLSDEMAHRALAGLVMVPKPADVDSLSVLTSSDADEDIIATRLGADTVLTLPVFDDAEGGRWLDEECAVPFPVKGDRFGRDGRRAFSRALVRELLGYVVPLAYGPWRKACTSANEPPTGWQHEPKLAGIILLPHVSGPEGSVGPVLGDRRLTLDHELGLVGERLM
ncbi:CRISPR-associated helicase Cas3' [Streptomyces sp. NBC_01511]|uniref:CRISPR-associated helicase Cas3' n=1 Tax=Streptomyces sp. NBC_01511 TaxID=2903889 RepID=UPI00386A5D04